MAENPQNIAQTLLTINNPQQAYQLQLQQALATQLMKQGSDPIEGGVNRTAAGGVAIPMSPFEGLAKALSSVGGAYLAKDVAQTQGDVTQKALAQALQPKTITNPDGSTSTIPALTMDDLNTAALLNGRTPLYDARASAYGKNLENTNTYKDARDPLIGDSVRGKMNLDATKTFDYNGKTNVPFTSPKPGTLSPIAIDGATPPQAPPAPQANSIPPIPAIPTYEQFNKGDKVVGGMPPAEGNNGRIIHDDNTGQQYKSDGKSWTPTQSGFGIDTIAQKGGEAQATEEGKNAADIRKTFEATFNGLPYAAKRFNELHGYADNAGYGFGNNAEGDGFAQQAHNLLGDKTSVANTALNKLSAQNIIPEIAPAIAAAGGRGNKFLEGLSATASGIEPSLNPASKHEAINKVADYYVNNLKAQAGQARDAGVKNVPSNEEIDAMVAKYGYKPYAGQTSAAPVTTQGISREDAIAELKRRGRM